MARGNAEASPSSLRRRQAQMARPIAKASEQKPAAQDISGLQHGRIATPDRVKLDCRSLRRRKAHGSAAGRNRLSRPPDAPALTPFLSPQLGVIQSNYCRAAMTFELESRRRRARQHLRQTLRPKRHSSS